MALQFRNYSAPIMYGAAIEAGDFRFADLAEIDDANGNEMLEFDTVAAAVNYMRLANSITATDPIFSAQGDDANVGLIILAKGTGVVTLRNDDAGATGSYLSLYHNSASPAAADIVGHVDFDGNDDAAALQTYGRIEGVIRDVGAASTDGDILFYVARANVLTLQMTLDSDLNGVVLGSGAATAHVSSNGAFDLIVSTNTNTASSNITITDAANGNVTFNMNGTASTVISNTDAGAVGAVLTFDHASASPAAADVVARLNFQGNDDAAADETYGRIECIIRDPAAASTDGDLNFSVVRANALTQQLALDSDLNGVVVGDGVGNAHVSTNGAFDLILSTNTNTTSSNITITDAATGAVTVNLETTAEFRVTGTDVGAVGAVVRLTHTPSDASEANADVIGRFIFQGTDDANAAEDYGRVDMRIKDVTAANPDGELLFYVDRAGTLTLQLELDPDTNGIIIGDGVGSGVVQSTGEFDLILRTGNAVTSNITITDGASGNITANLNGTGVFAIASTDAGAVGGQLTISQTGGSQAAADVMARILFTGQDDAAAAEDYGRIDVVVDSSAAAGPDSDMSFLINVNGTLTERLRLEQDASILAPAGIRYNNYAATATADGLTTGLIPLGSTFVLVTSANADWIVTLPAGTAGQIIWLSIGATGCEVRTPALSNATINNVDSDGGANELALGANTSYVFTCIATDTWIARGFTNLAADQAALVPDAV